MLWQAAYRQFSTALRKVQIYCTIFLPIMCPVFGELCVKHFHLSRVIMATKHLMDEELHEIMKSSSYEEHLEDKEEEDNKKKLRGLSPRANYTDRNTIKDNKKK